jgi:hypothetical protein
VLKYKMVQEEVRGGIMSNEGLCGEGERGKTVQINCKKSLMRGTVETYRVYQKKGKNEKVCQGWFINTVNFEL